MDEMFDKPPPPPSYDESVYRLHHSHILVPDTLNNLGQPTVKHYNINRLDASQQVDATKRMPWTTCILLNIFIILYVAVLFIIFYTIIIP